MKIETHFGELLEAIEKERVNQCRGLGSYPLSYMSKITMINVRLGII